MKRQILSFVLCICIFQQIRKGKNCRQLRRQFCFFIGVIAAVFRIFFTKSKHANISESNLDGRRSKRGKIYNIFASGIFNTLELISKLKTMVKNLQNMEIIEMTPHLKSMTSIHSNSCLQVGGTKSS